MSGKTRWPDLPLAAWSETCDTLHLWTQIVGKVRIALTPLVNHWWNVTLYVTARGLTAPAMPYAGARSISIFDFVDHRLVIATSDGRVESFALAPMTVADFYAEFMARLRRLGIDVHIWTMPSEIENAVPFDQDRTHAQYDPVYVQRFWRRWLQADRVMNEFRARFIGKASPVHFFWGSFDLAVTRFSGRTAPPPKGVTPNVAGWVMAEAYSHEVSSCGFWPGQRRLRPRGVLCLRLSGAGRLRRHTPVRSRSASTTRVLGQFILPYDAVRTVARSRRAAALAFCRKPTRPRPTWRNGTARRWSGSCAPHVSGWRVPDMDQASRKSCVRVESVARRHQCTTEKPKFFGLSADLLDGLGIEMTAEMLALVSRKRKHDRLSRAG